MSRVAIVTLGCPKNEIDSESLGGLLDAAGHDVGTDPTAADVVVVNTCGFIDPARRETIEEVLDLVELKRSGDVKSVVLTGCLVARSATELADSLPEVDAFVDFAAYQDMSTIVTSLAEGTPTARIHGRPGHRFDPAWWDAAMAAGPRLRFGRRPWAYLKIAEGCDRGCTFCAIPLMRGKLRSRSAATIEAEARYLVAAGVSEVSLVSQDSVMWARDADGVGLASLLTRLGHIEGLRRIRLMYLHPQGVTEDLIAAMAASEVVVSYFDLSMQHVSPPVLKAMGRWGSRDRFESMVERIRSWDPMAGIRATFILGFPGETDHEAAEVESFVAESDLDWIGVFQYSPEEGTRSFELESRVPSSIARERVERVAAAAELTMERRSRAVVGRTLEVLAEKRLPDDGMWIGRSHREAPEIDGEIRFTSIEPVAVGDYVDVRITGNEGADLVGVRSIPA
ncbi:MAG: 30S ribosomal protein S12 methylthiotransferase RimO [Actinomycetota bacterium]